MGRAEQIRLAVGFTSGLGLAALGATGVEAQQTQPLPQNCVNTPSAPVIPGSRGGTYCELHDRSNSNSNSGTDRTSTTNTQGQTSEGRSFTVNSSTNTQERSFSSSTTTRDSSLRVESISAPIVPPSPQVIVVPAPAIGPVAPLQPGILPPPGAVPPPPSYYPQGEQGNAIIANDPNNPSRGIVHRCLDPRTNNGIPCPANEYSPYYQGAAGLQNPNYQQYNNPTAYNYTPGQYNPNMSYTNPTYTNPNITDSARCDTIRRIGADLARAIGIQNTSC
jgi:hypothetical protein